MSINFVTPESEAHAETLLEEVLEVPFWVLENILYPRGVRLEHRTIYTEPTVRCSVCLLGVDAGDRVVVRKNQRDVAYHQSCYRSQIQTDLGYTNTSGVGPKVYPVEIIRLNGSNKDRELTGNLGDSEYHLWIGSRLVDNTLAICRCCKKACNGQAERSLHKVDRACF